MFLKACANLIPLDDERRRLVVEPVFRQCCKDGQVGEIVLKQLRLAAPDDLYQKLLGGLIRPGCPVRLEDIPLAWRRNLREDSMKDRRRVGTRKQFSNQKTKKVDLQKDATQRP
jgi:hypothetical protein